MKLPTLFLLSLLSITQHVFSMENSESLTEKNTEPNNSSIITGPNATTQPPQLFKIIDSIMVELFNKPELKNLKKRHRRIQ